MGFWDRYYNVEQHYCEMKQCMKEPTKTKEQCADIVFKPKSYDTGATKTKLKKARQIIEEQYFENLPETTPLPEKYPTMPEKMETIKAKLRPLVWNIGANINMHWSSLSGIWTGGELD